MSEHSDEHLMEAYRDDDAHAFELLFDRYKDMLYRYLVRQSGNGSLADEIFQETWAALIKNRKSYVVTAKFRTYLFHIARTKLIDYYRQNEKHTALSYDEPDVHLNLVSEDNEQPEQQADTRGKVQKLISLLDKLPALQREIFLMHEEAGMGLTEIAATMNISRDTAKSRLRYALEKLRKGMKHHL